MLLMYPGLLGRYGQLSILDELADSLGAHSLWVLAGSEHQKASPWWTARRSRRVRRNGPGFQPSGWTMNFARSKADQRRDP